MQVEIDLGAEPVRASLLERDDFEELKVVLVGVEAPFSAQLAPVGVVRFDEHAWLRIDAIRQLAGEHATPEWEARFASMLEIARSHDWLDEKLDAVRAHCERQLPGARPRAPSEAQGRPEAEPEQACDQGLYREVVSHFATGVAVITARHDGVDFGMTASALASLSVEPPTLLVCLSRESVTHSAIHSAGAFGVNILTESQGEIAKRFAGTDRAQKFDELRVRHGELGQPLLLDALARLECRVAEPVTGGTHTIFLGTVQNAEADEGAPLTYFRGRFGRFLDAHGSATAA
jgi:4-nitrophenol 2-monooxygenase / 4-nitrocatechol 4-monooxygenase, reductase component